LLVLLFGVRPFVDLDFDTSYGDGEKETVPVVNFPAENMLFGIPLKARILSILSRGRRLSEGREYIRHELGGFVNRVDQPNPISDLYS
jgi:hypothetical protein